MPAARRDLCALARVLARIRDRLGPACFLQDRRESRRLRVLRFRRRRGRVGRALDGVVRRCDLHGARAARADRGGGASRARPARAGVHARVDLVRGESSGGNGGRAPALRGLWISGARGEYPHGEAQARAAARGRRLCARLVRGGCALDPATAAALLAASRKMKEPFGRRKLQCASASGLHRIGSYVGKWPALPDIEVAEQYVRSISASFGPHTDAEWRFLTEHVVRKNADGSLRMHYDPAIAVALNAELPHKDAELWSFYDAIRCPTLVLRGEQSDMLPRDIAAKMATRGPRAKVVEIAGVGHAPTLLHDDQIRIVRDFLLAGDV